MEAHGDTDILIAFERGKVLIVARYVYTVEDVVFRISNGYQTKCETTYFPMTHAFCEMLSEVGIEHNRARDSYGVLDSVCHICNHNHATYRLNAYQLSHYYLNPSPYIKVIHTSGDAIPDRYFDIRHLQLEMRRME